MAQNELKKCTYIRSKTSFIKQPFFRCESCFSGFGSGVCSSCAVKCHSGHNLDYAGTLEAFCDCGLQECPTPCILGSKCAHDTGTMGVEDKVLYNCTTCIIRRWDGKETSQFYCCTFCAEICHKGHDLVPATTVIADCDCGSNHHMQDNFLKADDEYRYECENCTESYAELHTARRNIEKSYRQCRKLEAELNSKVKEVKVKTKEVMNLQKKMSHFQVSDLPELMLATVSVQTQWKQLGEALGVSSAVLESISSDESLTELRCLYEVLRYWVSEVGGSWGGLIGALRSSYIEQEKLASEHEKRYLGKKPVKSCSMEFSFPTIQRDEKPLEDTSVSQVMEAVFSPDSDGIVTTDWKVLGLMLGLPDNGLIKIESSNSSQFDCQKSMLRLWMESRHAYWSVLVQVMGGPVMEQRELAEGIRTQQTLSIKAVISGNVHAVLEKEDHFSVDEESIARKSQAITNALNKQTKGIVFFVGVSDCTEVGADRAAEHVAKAFRDELEFTFYRQENTNCTELSCLVQAIARGKWHTVKCKYIVFYYAGHGGIDERGDLFIKLSQSEESRFYIERDVLSHFNKVDNKRRCLFFFDLCFSEAVGTPNSPKYPDVPSHCLAVIFRSCSGEMSVGEIWTQQFCEKLKLQLSISDILDHTRRAVLEKCGETQPPVYVPNTGAVFLKGTPKMCVEDSVRSDPALLWKHYTPDLNKLLDCSQDVLLQLTGALHTDSIISDEIKEKVLHSKEGGKVITAAISEKISADPKLIHEVLSIMDLQDQLCGLVRRIRNELKDSVDDQPGMTILECHHDELVYVLQQDSTSLQLLCGGLLLKGLIDQELSFDVSKNWYDGGADKLIKKLEQRVHNDPNELGFILNVLEKQKPLRYLVQEMRKKINKADKDVGAQPPLISIADLSWSKSFW